MNLKSIALVALLASTMLACNNPKGKDKEHATKEASEAPKASAEAENLPAAVFISEDGTTYETADLKGKVVFMNFWATWCPPCVREMPSIQVLYDKFKDREDIVFLIVEIEGNADGAKTFMENEKLHLPVVFPNGDIPQEWLSGAIPSTVILDKAGKLATRHEGMFDFATKETEDFVTKLVNQ